MTLTLIFGGSLVALGVGAYLLTGRKSKTALIPAALGAVVGALGAAAVLNPESSGVVHVAALGLAAIGLLGTGRALVSWGKSLGGAAAGAALVSKAVMALLCLVFIGANIVLRV